MAVYSISDLSREFSITSRSSRYWEDIGLLFSRRYTWLYYPSDDPTLLKLIFAINIERKTLLSKALMILPT